MTIAHTQLLGLVVTALTGVAAQVDRQRTRPLPEGVATAARAQLRRAKADQLLAGHGAPIDWTTILSVTCLARAGASTTPDQAVDPLIQAVHAALSGNAALMAAGYTLSPAPELDWDQDEADERIGACAIHYLVTHRTDAVTLEQTP